MTIELTAAGRKPIRLEMPDDMAYFPPADSPNTLEETAWCAQHDFFRYRFETFRCKDFTIIRNSIDCATACCLRSYNMDSTFLGLSSVQQGCAECTLSADHRCRLWQAGFGNLMVCSGYKEECNYFRAGDPFEMTSILIAPTFFHSLTERYPELFASAYTRLTRGETFFFSPENLPVSATLTSALNAIELCRLMGNTSRMYLEAKVVESLSAFLCQTDAASQPAHPSSVAERDKIHQARDIIRSEYINPPSLRQLALRVGTNECTLKAGFKQLFHQTVFGYLFDLRMQLAVSLLLDTRLPIQEIALQVGYAYTPHFCTAFKRRFGIPPGAYRLARQT